MATSDALNTISPLPRPVRAIDYIYATLNVKAF